MLNFQGGQYKKIFSKTVEKMCEGLYSDELEPYFKDAMKSLSKPFVWKTCPIPAGPNRFNNFMMEDRILPPYIPGGEKWLIEIKIFKGEDLLGGYKYYATIRSEQSLLMG